MNTAYTLTEHAYERFRERVNIGKSKQDAMNWITTAIKHGACMGNRGEYRYYKFKHYKIVIGEKDKVVTISYFNDSYVKDFKREMNALIRNKFIGKLKPFYSIRKNLQIEIYEAKIRRLKTNNPETKNIIAGNIEELENELVKTISAIDSIIKAGEHYNVPNKELVKGD